MNGASVTLCIVAMFFVCVILRYSCKAPDRPKGPWGVCTDHGGGICSAAHVKDCFYNKWGCNGITYAAKFEICKKCDCFRYKGVAK